MQDEAGRLKLVLEASIQKAVRENKDLQQMVAMLPLTDVAKGTIWELLILAFNAGILHHDKLAQELAEELAQGRS